MYLEDRSLAALLPEIRVETESPEYSFEAQVQSASIDLRLSSVFWVPLRRFTIDLRRSRLLDIAPRRYYRRKTLTAGETLILRPHELLLARTLEQFSIPNGYAGELTGRSSFARLGLLVNATGGFINPGWRGHMPLQLFNLGPNAIRIVPGLPICQLRLVRLAGAADRPYGHGSLNSLYVNDDGGPSYWWRDKRIRALHERLAERSVEQRIQETLYATIGPREPEVVERLERLIARLRVPDLRNADEILEAFAAREERRRTRRRWLINLSRGSFTLGVTATLFMVNRTPPTPVHYVVWTLAACTVGLSVYAFRTEVGEHFGRAELSAGRNGPHRDA